MNKSNRGGKRKGAGRKAQGITKKVSLTLTQQLWDEINQFEGTVAGYIRFLKEARNELGNLNQQHENHKALNEVTYFNHHEANQEITKEYVQKLWEMYKHDFLLEQDQHNPVDDEAIERAHDGLFNGIFKKQDSAQIETSLRYRSPFTNKWFSSINNMLKSEVPWLINFSQIELTRRKENALRRQQI